MHSAMPLAVFELLVHSTASACVYLQLNHSQHRANLKVNQSVGWVDHTSGIYVACSFRTAVWFLLRPPRIDDESRPLLFEFF